MKGQDYCSCGDCRLCWPRISKPRVAIGLLLWVGALFCTRLAAEYPALWGMQWSVPLGVMILRAYLSIARLTMYFFGKYPLRWRCLILCFLFTLVPVLDVAYLAQGAPKVVVRPFFINEWPNLMDELVEEICYSGNYNVSIQGKNSFIVDASSGQYDVKICGDKIRIAHNENTAEVQCCVLDGPYELAARIVTQIEG